MISRRTFFDALYQRSFVNKSGELPAPSMLPNYLRMTAHILYARFLGTQLKMTHGYDVFSTALGQMIWDSKPMIPGSSRDDFNKGRADLTWTNSLRSNCFSLPESMLVGGIMVMLDANTPPEELAAFRRNVVGRLKVADKSLFDVPMALAACTADGDLTDIVNEVRDENLRVNLGTPTENILRSYVPIDPPINLEPLMHFGFILESPHSWDVPEDLGGYVFLDGVKFGGVS